MDTALDFYFWPTPNGWKISILLEELNLPYKVIPVNIARGEQYDPSFASVSPNNKIPAITDHQPMMEPTGESFSLFESGAIMQYLACKYGRFIPEDPRQRWHCLQWLNWQVGGLGPMGGQAHHFRKYATEEIPYARERYSKECRRLYAVLEAHLKGRSWICDQLSIADMACLPWIFRHEWQGIQLEEFPAIHSWYAKLMSREGVNRGFDLGKGWRGDDDFHNEEARRFLFANAAGSPDRESDDKK